MPEKNASPLDTEQIALRDVTLGYPGKTVLEHLNLTFTFGHSYALMGKSGGGKTTLMRAAAGLLKPLSGEITGTAGHKIAYMFQEDRLLPWLSALENVSLVSDDEKAAYWLKKMEIADTRQKPGQMSGGMQRRVAIARAMAFGGDILLMDEPFKGLDSALRQRVAERIRGVYPLTVLSVHDTVEADLMGAEIVDLT